MSKKLTYEFVKSRFEEDGCILISTEYKSAQSKLKYMCSCGNTEVQEISYDNFNHGHRCILCGNQKSTLLRRHSFNFIKYIFEKEGCQLISTVYVNNGTKLQYLCSCGNTEVQEIAYRDFQQGSRCSSCGYEKVASSMRLSYELVKSTFEKEGCQLISPNYVNNYINLQYMCSCGNPEIQNISYNHFQSGHRCRSCGYKKISGVNSPHWNSNITQEERAQGRNYPEYTQWIKDVYTRDNYICQKCDGSKGGGLNAHHINSYSQFTELRTVLSNGVTLCKCCHKEFHSLYGKVKFTAEDFEEFMLINTDTLLDNGGDLHKEIEDEVLTENPNSRNAS